MHAQFINGGPVSETLFLPMASRIYVSERFPEYFYDGRALELAPSLPEGMDRGMFEYAHLASAARFRMIDRMTADFIARCGECNVVSLGAGLDTAYDRISAAGKEGRARFFAVDLPDVMALRQKMLGSRNGEAEIAGDMFDMHWTEAMDSSLPTLMTAVGVFQYFTRSKIAAFIGDLKQRFPHGRLLFDAASRRGLRFCNWFAARTGNKAAKMSFYVNDGEEFAGIAGAKLIEERLGFEGTLGMIGKKVGLASRLCIHAANAGRSMIIVYLDLEG